MTQPTPPVAGIRVAFGHAFEAHEAARAAREAAQHGTPRRIAASEQPVTSVEQAIASAAQQTTIDFDFLVAQAQVESAMNPHARARTSSATGLYQFIDSTWLSTMQRHGGRFGLGEFAAQIGVASDGSAYVSDPAARAGILALRNDPQIAALMAAGLAEDNRAHLTPILGRQPDHGELYLAHFLGAGGAGRFLSALAADPGQSAAALFRSAASANRPIFYEANGSPRSLAGVMRHLSVKLERARASAGDGAERSYPVASLAPPPTSSIAAQPMPARYGAASSFASGRAAYAAPARLAMAQPGGAASMSGLLQSAFGVSEAGSGQRAAAHVQRAYEQLKALGL